MEATPCFTEGFIYDSMKLIEEFKACKSTEFRVFAEKWKQMEFGKVFNGHSLVAEIREVSEEYLRIAKGIMLHGEDLLSKIGGLFLMYGLFYKQPIIRHGRVRFTLEDWESFRRFCEEIDDEKYQNLRHIISKLYIDDALVLVFSDKDYGLDRGSLKYFREPDLKQSIEVTKNFISQESPVSAYFELSKPGGLLEKAQKSQEAYNKFRRELGFSSTKLDLNKLLTAKQYQTSSTTETKPLLPEKDKNPTPTIGNTRRSIKQKAFKQ